MFTRRLGDRQEIFSEECRIEQKQRRMLFNVTPEGRGILRHSKIDYNTRMISLFVFLLHQMEFPSCIVSIKFRSARSNEAAKKFVLEMGKLAFSNPISSGKFRNFPSKHLLALCKIFENFQTRNFTSENKSFPSYDDKTMRDGWKYHLFIFFHITDGKFTFPLRCTEGVFRCSRESSKIYFDAI